MIIVIVCNYRKERKQLRGQFLVVISSKMSIAIGRTEGGGAYGLLQ